MMLTDKNMMKLVWDEIYEAFKDKNIDYIAGIESRGFIFGMPLAYKMNCGFIPVRKPKKLPAEVISQEYELEYGTDKIEIHKDALKKGDKVLIVDDFLANGEALRGLIDIVEKCNATVVGCCVQIEKEYQNGGNTLRNKGYKVIALASIKEMTSNKILFN